MSSEQVHVALIPGEGTVARLGVGLMVILPGGSEEIRDSLLEGFEEACADGETPGRMMARRLVGLLSQNDPEDIPPFGACAPNDRGWAVILHQGVALHLNESDGGHERVSGHDASTWVDRIIDSEFDSMVLLADDVEPPQVQGRFRLDRGIIPGAGATILVPAAVPASTGQPESAGEEESTAEHEPVPEPEAEPVSEPQPEPAIEPETELEPATEPEQVFARESVAVVPEEPAADDGPAGPPPSTSSFPGPSVAQPPPAVPPTRGTPESTVPAPVTSGFVQTPTPTGNPEQQGVIEATPASQDIPRGILPSRESGEAMNGDEDEPPTLIQAPNREPAEPAALNEVPEPEALPEADVEFESVPLRDIGQDVRRAPLPVLTADTPKEETEDADAPLVHGVMSPAGYFNHPDALYCAVTGVAMLHRTHVLVERPRPPLGVVVADDGSTFTLNSGYVVGREPERDPLVESDDARPLKLQDSERSLSRVHAEIRLQDWDVFVVDRGSANGTYVLPRGAQQWKRLVADSEEKVVPGTRVAFGKRVVTYESHHQINQAAS